MCLLVWLQWIYFEARNWNGAEEKWRFVGVLGYDVCGGGCVMWIVCSVELCCMEYVVFVVVDCL